MAATLITVSKVGTSGITIEIKVNNGHPVPQELIDTANIDSFRTWEKETMHIFVWKTTDGKEKSMLVPKVSIGWILASRNQGVDSDRFRINNPCTVMIESMV